MAGEAGDQAVNPTFSAEVRLVRVEVEVVQGQRPVTGLAREDFQVTDNGEKRPIRHFSESAEPLDLVLLLYVSGSMKPQLEAVSAAARDAFAVLRPDDRIGVWTFDLKARMITPLSSDHAQVRAQYRQQGPQEGGRRHEHQRRSRFSGEVFPGRGPRGTAAGDCDCDRQPRSEVEAGHRRAAQAMGGRRGR